MWIVPAGNDEQAASSVEGPGFDVVRGNLVGDIDDNCFWI